MYQLQATVLMLLFRNKNIQSIQDQIKMLKSRAYKNVDYINSKDLENNLAELVVTAAPDIINDSSQKLSMYQLSILSWKSIVCE